MIEQFRMLAGYNQWANRRVYDAAAAVPETEYRAERGAFFGSLHRTLNHILVGDRIWMQRFTGKGPSYTDLETVPCADLATLRTEREAEDARIIAWVDGLSEAALNGTFSYRTIAQPADITQALAPALSHFFNHQTHHRGQAHCLLTAMAGRDAAPSLDLILFQRETGVGLS